MENLTNKQSGKARPHKWKNEVEIHHGNIYRSIFNGARNRKLEFELSREFVILASQKNCFYCNSAPMNTSKIQTKIKQQRQQLEYSWNGLDRIDNSFGYIEKNVVTCCKNCNKAKNILGYKEFMNWINIIRGVL